MMRKIDLGAVSMMDPKKALRQWLEIMREITPKIDGYHYRSARDFVLQHGEWYEPAPWKKEWPKGAPRCCFANAILEAHHRGWKYIEGFALSPLFLEVHHAWNVTPDGVLIDTTWRNTGLAYCGVEFSIGRADTASWTDDATVLDNPRNKFAIMRQPWKGEDFSIVWEKSEALQYLLGEMSEEQAVKFIETLPDAKVSTL